MFLLSDSGGSDTVVWQSSCGPLTHQQPNNYATESLTAVVKYNNNNDNKPLNQPANQAKQQRKRQKKKRKKEKKKKKEEPRTFVCVCVCGNFLF